MKNVDVNDIVGEKFNRLTVLSFSHKQSQRNYYLCKCECGNESIVRRDSLLSGQTQSCGCLVKTTTNRKTIDSTDIVGQKFNRWTVVSFHHKDENKYYYLCKCECGTERVVLRKSLLNQESKSCGCLKNEKASLINLKHHLYKHPLRSVWSNMKQRCYNPNNKKYYCYGARGIKVCDEWLNNFQTFYEWSMDNGYKKGLTIDRINSNGNYTPLNCRWVTVKIQNNNTSRNRILTYNNESHTVSEWAEILHINRNTLQAKILKGYNIQEIISQH